MALAQRNLGSVELAREPISLASWTPEPLWAYSKVRVVPGADFTAFRPTADNPQELSAASIEPRVGPAVASEI